MNYILSLALIQLVYFAPPKIYIDNSVLEEYFQGFIDRNDEVQALPARSMMSITTLEKHLDSLFPEGHYLNLEDSLVQEIIKNHTGPTHWYAEELNKYPKSFHGIFLASGTDGIIGYNFVMIVDKKGKIAKIEKWGYGM